MESEQKSMINGDKDYSSAANINTTMVSSVIKHEMIDPGLESKSIMVSKSENSHMPSTSNVLFTSSANNNINNNNSPKMGSRRIFTPQFKLQVLESYRNDNDCKGNQRATARKYNIHRRQIQKWLQCESNLRSSVANINQSNVKHQFHNITSRQQQPQQQQQLQIPVANSNNHFSHHNHHHNHHHHPLQHQLPLDAAGQSVALNSITVPSLPTGVITSTNASTQGVLAAANLAAVVAAAAAAGAAGAMVIASTSSTNTSTTVSPLRPTAIGCRSNATMSPSLLHSHHHQQHHHYQIPYTHTPAGSVPVSVPILTHHIPPQHLHHHYQYHNLSPHAHTLTHQQPSAFMPSACLPVTVLSTAVSASTSTTTTSAPALGSVDEKGEEQNEQNISNELREATKTTTATANCADVTGNRYVHSHEYVYKCTENGTENKHEGKYEGLQQYSFIRESPYSVTVTPMDLSLGSRRYNRDNINYNLQNLSKTDDLANRSEYLFERVINDNSVVDLTFRKRKVIAATTNADEQPEKLGKFSSIENKPESDIKTEVKETDVSKENNEDDIELEVEEKSPPSKPIKLFKPYLLGDNDDDDKSCNGNSSATCSKVNTSEQREPIIWSNHPACVSPHSYDSRQDSSRGSNFQSPSAEKYTFPIGSPYFQGSKTSSPQSVLSPTSAPALSPSFPCPKGSPVSGYESSSSTYSDTSYRSDPYRIITNGRTYNLNLQMHAVYNDNVIQEQNCVQRWLDQDTNTNPPATNASIALYA